MPVTTFTTDSFTLAGTASITQAYARISDHLNTHSFAQRIPTTPHGAAHATAHSLAHLILHILFHPLPLQLQHAPLCKHSTTAWSAQTLRCADACAARPPLEEAAVLCSGMTCVSCQLAAMWPNKVTQTIFLTHCKQQSQHRLTG